MRKRQTTRTSPPPQAQRRWISSAEACAIACCSRRTLHTWTARGLVDSRRPIQSGSGRRLFDRDSLLRFLGIDEGSAA